MWNHQTADKTNYELLRNFARENRKNATLAEHVLWQHLRAGALGEKFLRQHIIGPYIVDFVSQDSGLVIEVDGAYHSEPAQEDSDEARTDYLASEGFHVMRFSNEEVLYGIDDVLDAIIAQLES